MRYRLFCHVVWATLDREPSIDLAMAEYLCERLPQIAQEERAQVLELGIVSTHVHLLVRLRPLTNVPRLIQRMKGGTSVHRSVKWSRGYSLDGISFRGISGVVAYVRNQPTHHPEMVIPGFTQKHLFRASDIETDS